MEVPMDDVIREIINKPVLPPPYPIISVQELLEAAGDTSHPLGEYVGRDISMYAREEHLEFEAHLLSLIRYLRGGSSLAHLN